MDDIEFISDDFHFCYHSIHYLRSPIKMNGEEYYIEWRDGSKNGIDDCYLVDKDGRYILINRWGYDSSKEWQRLSEEGYIFT